MDGELIAGIIRAATNLMIIVRAGTHWLGAITSMMDPKAQSKVIFLLHRGGQIWHYEHMNNTHVPVINQIKLSLLRSNRMAFTIGTLLGGLVPFVTFMLAHYYVTANPVLWLLVGGGLLFSAMTVFQWGRMAFGNGWKSAGFVLLLEGVMTFTDIYLAGLALATLVFINATATACRLVLESSKPKARKVSRPVKLARVA
jgi:hypothetical protein